MTIVASLTLKPDADTLFRATHWLTQVAGDHNWPPRTTFALQLSMDEALSNTLMHGFTQGMDHPSVIELALIVEYPLITLEIIDNGIRFDPTSITPADLAATLEDAVPGGHGIRVMRHYLHDIRYTFAGGRNHLRLTVRQSGV